MIKKGITIGSMKNRISILNKIELVGDIGETSATWSVSGGSSVWAYVKKTTPDSVIQGGLKTGEKVYEIYIRENDNLKINSKLRYEIKSGVFEFMRVVEFGELAQIGDELIKIIAIQSDNEVVTVS